MDIRDHAGWLPIHEAAVHNQMEIAKILVEHGTDVNDRAGKLLGCTWTDVKEKSACHVVLC